MIKPEPKSPNMKRMDNIERMARIVTREAEKVISERDKVAADRDAWRARAETAERQLEAVRAVLGDQPEPIAANDEPSVPVARRRRRVPREPGAPEFAEPLGGITDEIAQAIANAPGAKVAASAPATPKAAPIVGDDLNADQRAILAALSPEWQTVLQLHKSAVEHGFSKGNQTVRNYMLRGLASRDGIETRETPLAWRLKGTPPEGGDKITTHEQAIMRVITTEPQSFDNIWTAAAKVYCGGKAGVFNSTLRAKLNYLTDAGRLIKSGVRGAYSWRLAPEGGDKIELLDDQVKRAAVSLSSQLNDLQVAKLIETISEGEPKPWAAVQKALGGGEHTKRTFNDIESLKLMGIVKKGIGNVELALPLAEAIQTAKKIIFEAQALDIFDTIKRKRSPLASGNWTLKTINNRYPLSGVWHFHTDYLCQCGLIEEVQATGSHREFRVIA